MKQVLAIMAVGGMVLANGLSVPTAHAACADDAAMTKDMLMELPDGDTKTMALENVAMAMEKAAAHDEAECMAQVMKAKMALDGDAMGDTMGRDKMEKAKTN